MRHLGLTAIVACLGFVTALIGDLLQPQSVPVTGVVQLTGTAPELAPSISEFSVVPPAVVDLRPPEYEATPGSDDDDDDEVDESSKEAGADRVEVGEESTEDGSEEAGRDDEREDGESKSRGDGRGDDEPDEGD